MAQSRSLGGVVVACACVLVVLSSDAGACAGPLPLSDPHNHSGWVPFAPLTDEFDGPGLDMTKWMFSVGWPGRAPGLFDPSNVQVDADSSSLKLFARNAQRNASWPAGFDNFTTAAIHSRNLTARGYFEVRSRSGSSAVSSSWWLHQNTPGPARSDGLPSNTWTEIDVFESTGSQAEHEKDNMNSTLMCSHLHVFNITGVDPKALPERCGCKNGGEDNKLVCTVGGCTSLGRPFDGDFHVYGLQWNATDITVFADGTIITTLPGKCFTQPIGMDFDRETMPDWMGLPDPSHLPDQPFEVDYVRTWKQPTQ